MEKNRITLTYEQLQKLSAFLQKETGISLEEQKLLRFQRKIEDIFKKHNIEDFNRFYHQLRFVHNEELVQDLVNAVTVNETYFWRENEQFRILTKEILPQFVSPKEVANLRILVSPCSSGEEVYSIMLAILDEADLIEKLNIELVGIDIDSNMIAKAKRALYTQRSVDRLPKHLLKRYFTKVGAFYQFDKELAKLVNFKQINIFEENLLLKLGTFDILFSRNMLIYFNKEDKERAFEQFYRLLKSRGYLFLGHADTNGIDKSRFVPLPYGFGTFQKR